MTANKKITKKYENKKAMIKVKSVVINLVNGLQIPINCDCRIDTGFDGGLLIPIWHEGEIKSIDVQPRPTNIRVADGSKIPALVCAVHIQQIEDQTFPMPGRPVILVMCGNYEGILFGMDALKQSTLFLHGPNQEFTITP